MKKVVVIGGGTGNFTVLSGLKHFPVELSAIVSMADDGGSTGILRDHLGVLPPGDVRQCLVALSDSSNLLRRLMNYRFENGDLGGHSFGNLLLSALEKVTGSFETAVDEVGKILAIKGKVIPVTTHQVRLKMVLENGGVLEGEKEIYLSEAIDQGYQKIFLVPDPLPNSKAIDEILNADLIIIGPGGLHTSLIPNLLIDGIKIAVQKSLAKKVFVVNLMNRKGQTTGYKVKDYVHEICRYLERDCLDYILVNNQRPDEQMIMAYSEQGELVVNDMHEDRVMEAPLLGEIKQAQKNDLIKRNLIRHDSKKLAQELMKIVNYL